MMAGRTSRFGFTTIGGSEGGSFTDEGNRFSLHDPLLLDQILAAVERHDHRFVPAVEVEDLGAPSLNVGRDGSLEGGLELFYRVSVLDALGLS